LTPELNIDMKVGCFFISTSIYERVLKKAGFDNVKQQRFYIPVEGEEEVKAKMADFFKVINMWTYEATRPAIQ